jgi:glycosyltransferase involved in cell wall biosynthesis
MSTDPADATQAAEAEPVAVAFVASYGQLGGSEIYLERLLSHLASGWISSVIVLGHGPLADRLREQGHRVDVIPTGASFSAMMRSSWHLRRIFAATRPALVHANGLKAALAAVPAAFGRRLPVLWVRHDFSYEGHRARALARMCGGVVCVSHALADTFHGKLARKVRVVPTGLPGSDISREAARGHLGDLGGDPLISLVGQLIPGKGHLELVAIAPQLRARLPGIRILFVGGEAAGSYGATYLVELRRRVAELGEDDVIEFLGHRDDALMVVARSAMVVMPSVAADGTRTEGFPLVALESLALGTPLVGYAVGGLPELVGDCASLVRPGDRQGLLEQIVRVATDRSSWERMSGCGRERVGTRFSMNSMITGLQRAYRMVASG